MRKEVQFDEGAVSVQVYSALLPVSTTQPRLGIDASRNNGLA
jgi:hypothetical protein